MSGGPGSANPWIGPTVEETILSLKAKGHRGVFIHPVGFLCDHVEVLYDIDIFFKQFAEKEGMRLWRAESLNGSKTLTAALADLVRRRTGRKLTEPERALVLALAPNAMPGIDDARVVEMQDGGMGSIKFINVADRRRSHSIAEAEYLDDDGVLVSIDLSVDENGELFEVDFWKVDFSPLRRYPCPEDLKSLT